MRAVLEQQVLPETAAVLATSDRNAQLMPTTGKDRVVPQILVPLVKVSQGIAAQAPALRGMVRPVMCSRAVNVTAWQALLMIGPAWQVCWQGACRDTAVAMHHHVCSKC